MGISSSFRHFLATRASRSAALESALVLQRARACYLFSLRPFLLEGSSAERHARTLAPPPRWRASASETWLGSRLALGGARAGGVPADQS
jgi:hypothetical protein